MQLYNMVSVGGLQNKIETFNKKCGNVSEKNTSLIIECEAEQSQIKKEKKELIEAINEFNNTIFSEPPGKNDSKLPMTIEELKKSINKLAKKLRWSDQEQSRLAKALDSLDADGTPGTTIGEGYKVWANMKIRENDLSLIREAAKVGGVGFPGAGTQTTNDCTIFALANAAGLPYGVAAARATKMISEGDWRDPSEKANPEIVFKNGLNGHEVIMLAEVFGQAQVVPSSAFITTLNEGHPILLGVTLTEKEKDNTYSQGNHEVVLTKSFQYKGETWFEMMDSNQQATVRHYLTTKELGIIMFEKGVAYRPDPGTVPKLLRK